MKLALGALLLAGLCLGLFFWRLGDRDLWSSHEGRAAMNARSVLERSLAESGGLPRLDDGRTEVQKPPLFYWLVAGLASLPRPFGGDGEVDALVVRLPSALAGLGCVLLLALAVGRDRPLAGLLAGLVLATTIHVTWLARIGRIDLPLAFTTSCAAFAVYRAGPDSSRHELRVTSSAWLMLGYGAAALGVLLKGPLGLILPAAVITCHLLVEGRWPAVWEWGAWRRLLRDYRAGWGLALLLTLTVPVFTWAEWSSGGTFLGEFFWHHNVQRGLGGSRLRAHPWYQYGPFFALYFLPWTPVFAAALLDRRWRDDPLARFGLAWAVGVAAVLTCARFKRADYLLPAYPGAALFVGCALARWAERWPRRLSAGVAVVVAGVVLGWGYRLTVTLPAEEAWRDYTRFARLVRESARQAGLPQAPVLFVRTEAHALAFHVGRPQAVVIEWEALRGRLAEPGRHTLVVPEEELEALRAELPGVALDVLARTTDAALTGGAGRHERPLAPVVARGCQTAAGHLP